MGVLKSKLERLLRTKADIKMALTEQGRSPSDVFSSYADEIRAIRTGVELPELTNPGVAEDLLDGKELIDSDGNIVHGTLVPLDTSDATATAENIDSGYTAYINGVKLTGTSTKVDTSDATAAASDIAKGMTAYVNGERVTGSVGTVPNGSFTNLFASSAEVTTMSDCDYVKLNGTITSTDGTLFQNGAQYNAMLEASNFGDATAANVAAGKTFTSAAGVKVVGTLKEYSRSSMFPLYSAPTGAFTMNDTLYTSIYHKPSSDGIVKSTDFYGVNIPCNNFGDATAADVASGKTFTSAAGVNIVGTANAVLNRTATVNFTNNTGTGFYLVLQKVGGTYDSLNIRSSDITFSRECVVGGFVFVRPYEGSNLNIYIEDGPNHIPLAGSNSQTVLIADTSCTITVAI